MRSGKSCEHSPNGEHDWYTTKGEELVTKTCRWCGEVIITDYVQKPHKHEVKQDGADIHGWWDL